MRYSPYLRTQKIHISQKGLPNNRYILSWFKVAVKLALQNWVRARVRWDSTRNSRMVQCMNRNSLRSWYGRCLRPAPSYHSTVPDLAIDRDRPTCQSYQSKICEGSQIYMDHHDIRLSSSIAKFGTVRWYNSMVQWYGTMVRLYLWCDGTVPVHCTIVPYQRLVLASDSTIPYRTNLPYQFQTVRYCTVPTFRTILPNMCPNVLYTYFKST